MELIVTHIHDIPIRLNLVESLPYDIRLKGRSKTLRKMGNYPEVVFWQQVHRNKFWNIDFDRQKIIGCYIVDFYVKSLGLVIEIDGSSHDNKEVYDERRENYLKSLGLKVFRINDWNVLHDLGSVMKNLEVFIIEHYS